MTLPNRFHNVPDEGGGENDRLKAAREKARAVQTRLDLLLEANDVLATSIDYETTLANVSDLAVRKYADWCIVCLTDGGRLAMAVGAHRDPSKKRYIDEIIRRYLSEALADDCWQPESLPLLLSTVDDNMLKQVALDDHHLQLMRAVGIASALIVPLKSSDRMFGLIGLFLSPTSNWRFDENSLLLAQDLAVRASAAIERSKHHHEAERHLERLEMALAAGKMGTWEWEAATDTITWSFRPYLSSGSFALEVGERYETFLNHVHPDDRESLKKTLDHALNSMRCEPFQVECRFLSPRRGAYQWISVRGEVVAYDSLGKPAHMAGVFIDISEQKDMERALQEANLTLRRIVETSPLAIVTMDEEGRVREWNGAARRLTGWSKEEVVGKLNPLLPEPLAEVVGGQTSSWPEWIHQGASSHGMVGRVTLRGGRKANVTMWDAPFLDEQGQVQGHVAIYMDVTDRTRFLRVASHELSDPLSSIKALGSLISLYAKEEKVGTKIVRNLDRLQSEIDRMAVLLNEIFTAFRAEQKSLPLHPEPLDLWDVVEASVESLSFLESHRIVLKGPSTGTATVHGDHRRLSQVVRNLLLNAVKYSPGGGEIRIEVAVEADCVVLSVEDQGMGIPAFDLPHIFEPFYRSEREEMHGVEGIGVGLFICQEIVHRHGGRIWVKSKEGEGATFFVELPPLHS